MSDIYGQLTEHPEYPITDVRHFTITIKSHDFEQAPRKRGLKKWASGPDPFCARCGYHKIAAIHPQETPA